MIVVTGTKRSGTSMWMQVLEAAGFPVIGERFPANWETAIGSANPRGFYESSLVAGIHHRTNPHPVTGDYLFPEHTRRHAVKVFAPGVVRSDVAFLDAVIMTIRPWREFAVSLRRLQRDTARASGLEDSRGGVDALHPALEWWADHFAVIRDVATRRYPFHIQSYESLLARPAQVLSRVCEWLDGGDVDAAVQAIDPGLARACQADPEVEGIIAPPELAPGSTMLFDELYDVLHRGEDLSPAFVDRLNALDEALRPHFVEHEASVRREAARRLLSSQG